MIFEYEIMFTTTDGEPQLHKKRGWKTPGPSCLAAGNHNPRIKEATIVSECAMITIFASKSNYRPHMSEIIWNAPCDNGILRPFCSWKILRPFDGHLTQTRVTIRTAERIYRAQNRRFHPGLCQSNHPGTIYATGIEQIVTIMSQKHNFTYRTTNLREKVLDIPDKVWNNKHTKKIHISFFHSGTLKP